MVIQVYKVQEFKKNQVRNAKLTNSRKEYIIYIITDIQVNTGEYIQYINYNVTSTHKAHVTVYNTDVEQTNDSTQKTKGTNYKLVIA